MNNSAEYQPDGTLTLDTPVQLPDILDILVVGGGPAGTAAAFRAKELGLAALVIDYDDIMKRIRDYAKDKLILPDFGGGDKMQFPVAGDLIARLAFGPLDKDEMFALWKSFYRECNIPAQTGMELLGLDGRTDGIWSVRAYNHSMKAEKSIRARHVVLAIGRGVPRRFDIPGNTDGIAYRLNDAASYIGQPACVIGGGTSAAEAVIEISGAKIRAADASAVYWSYRGDKLPKVSKALADAFFEAYIGNGNIRYHPGSEPFAVISAGDKREYLSIRTDRRLMQDRPSESIHLEFLKEYCIACIGEDIPEGLLNSMGISLTTGGASMKKRMTVSPLLETQQPNVYLIGDILSQAYLETADFSGDPSAFREIKHRGNIKAALVDGVYVVDVIKQKLEGRADIRVEIQLAEAAPASVARKTELSSPLPSRVVESAGPPPQSYERSREVKEQEAYLVRLLPGNVEETEYPLRSNGITTIGRTESDISFSEDQFLSDHHASISHGADGYTLRDDGSENGVLYRAPEGVALDVSPGQLVKLGRQFLLFQGAGAPTSFIHYNQAGQEIRRYDLREGTIVVGRDAPDATLDADDGTMSRRHLSIATKGGRVLIKDLKSLNGTYLKLLAPVRLKNDDRFRIGQQLFRFVMKEELSSDRVHSGFHPAYVPEPQPDTAPPPRAQMPPASMARAPEAQADGAPAAAAEISATEIVFQNLGRSVPLEKGKTICDIAEKNGIKIVAECHAGICGSDPIRILAGRDSLAAPGDDETGTLEDICGLEAGECRLACMVRPTRGLVVEILENK